ncbi:uncharacterized protein F4822DRAFT_426618 [Hypoxylon trugodes]|uniref:uncharacterized protein n=1 Tax=Hypoxylon trugodes TaxID=326681 RepID=UPI002199753A|nr:uncharacterized protein F4822DRAFT_426618 [Hypoxylon trugodes]KAI1390773.1 hypothetical protein F4822DRAFT_426618 [Hypoxylon trugodes]
MSTSEVIYLPVVPVVRDQLIVNAVAASLAIAIICLRFYSRTITSNYGWDDGWVIVALAFSMALFGEQVALRNMGEGYDFDSNSPVFLALVNNVPIIFKILFSFGIIYLLALASVKMSVLFFYLRTFSTVSMKRVIWATMGVVFIWCLAHSLAFIFVCHPMQAWWDTTAGTCGDLILIYASIVVTNIVTDLIIMGLPMYTIWHLQMRKTEKVALTIAFGLGFASIIVACKRLAAVFTYDVTENPTGTVGESAFLCVLETFLALLCVNIPMLRPLVRRWMRSQSSSRLEGSEGPGSYFSKNSKGGTLSSGNHISKNRNPATGGREEWDMTVYGGTAVDSASVDDSGSEKRLTEHGTTNPPPGQIAVHTKWAVTRN